MKYLGYGYILKIMKFSDKQWNKRHKQNLRLTYIVRFENCLLVYEKLSRK